MRIRNLFDPRSGMEMSGSRIRDKHPGSATLVGTGRTPDLDGDVVKLVRELVLGPLNDPVHLLEGRLQHPRGLGGETPSPALPQLRHFTLSRAAWLSEKSGATMNLQAIFTHSFSTLHHN
jgi:hypothetical protein